MLGKLVKAMTWGAGGFFAVLLIAFQIVLWVIFLIATEFAAQFFYELGVWPLGAIARIIGLVTLVTPLIAILFAAGGLLWSGFTWLLRKAKIGPQE